MPRLLIDIINDIVDDMRGTGSILNIVESPAGTYTITTDKINTLLRVNQVIEITNTDGFNSNHIITSINTTNKQIQFTATSGITIPVLFGEWKAKAPFYYYENIPGYAEYLNNQNSRSFLDTAKFPSVFLVIPTRKNIRVRNRQDRITRAIIYLLNHTEPELKMPARHVKTFPYLREMEELFIEGLGKSNELIGEINLSSQELPFFGSFEQNNLNSTVDAIEIELTDFFISENICKNTEQSISYNLYNGNIYQYSKQGIALESTKVSFGIDFNTGEYQITKPNPYTGENWRIENNNLVY